MSKQSLDTATQGTYPTTPPQYKSLQQLISRWGRRATGRGDIFCTILPREAGELPMPALFLPSVGQIQVPESAFDGVYLDEVPTLEEFIRRYPVLFGKFAHEFGHAGWSPDSAYLDAFRSNNTHDQYKILMTLLEGHAERGIWKSREDDPLARLALQSTVLSVVLDGVRDEETGEVNTHDPAKAVELMGLIAARVDVGIVDTSEGTAGQKIWTALQASMGDYADQFFQIGREFSTITMRYGYRQMSCVSYHDTHRMRTLVLEWEELRRRFLEENPPPEQPSDGGGEGEEEEENGDDQEGSQEGQENGQDESQGQSEGQDQDGQGQSERTPDGTPDDGTGESGSGRQVLDREENTGANAYGGYGAGISFDADALLDAIESLEGGAEQEEQTAVEEIGRVETIWVGDTRRTSEQWDRIRRDRKDSATRVWDARRRRG